MTAGITVWNTWGTVQIDDTWANLSLRHKVQVSTWQTGVDGARGYQGQVTLPAVTPMMFIKPTASCATKKVTNNGDGTWTWTFVTLDPATITCYCFDKPVWLTQWYGLEIYDGAGNKTFGDQYAPLKVAGVFQPGGASVAPTNFYETPWYVSGLPASSYAVALSDPGGGAQFSNEDLNGAWSQTLLGACRDTQTGAAFSYVPVESINGDYGPGDFFPSKFIIIADVSGL